MLKGLRVERAEHVMTLTIDREDAANALDWETLNSLRIAVQTVAPDDSVRVLVITGAGQKTFCAGADLKERAGMDDDAVREYVQTIRDTLSAIAKLPQPTIAAVNGHALGGGTELAIACDIRIASSNATLGLTETGLGIIPGGGGTQRLPRLVGMGRAKEMIFTARRVPAEEALRIGLVEEVVETDRLPWRVAEVAKTIASNGPIAIRAAKEAIILGLEQSLDDGLALESALYGRTINTLDRLEGLAAFRDKRPPVFRGK